MIVDKLVFELRKHNGDLEVFFQDSERGEQKIESLEARESYAPSGIPFLLLGNKKKM